MVIAIAASSIAFGQTKMSKDTGNSVETQIIALEKQGWEAWKNKNSSRRIFEQKFRCII